MRCCWPGCGPAEDVDVPAEATEQQAASAEETGSAEQAEVSTSGFTSHFRTWLTNNGYEPTYNLVRGDLAGGSCTPRIPGQTGEKVYSDYPYGHFNSKDLTQNVQLNMVKNHTIP